MKHRWFRWITGFVLLLLLLFTGMVVLTFYHPKTALVFIVNRLAPTIHFNVDSVQWTSRHSIQLRNVRLRDVIKIPRMTLRWEWRNLWHRHLAELRLGSPEVILDLKAGLFGEFAPKGSSRPKPPPRAGAIWHLDILRVERGRLSILGLGPHIPPVELELEGTFDDIPLGNHLSEEDLNKVHCLELRNLQFRSPLDPVTVLVAIRNIRLEFRFAGLRTGELDTLLFGRPVLVLDPGFFWFIEQLRLAETDESGASGPEKNLDWRVRKLMIRDGRLDIGRLRGITTQCPFEFELTRENFQLRDLSLADLQLELIIPNQDISVPALDLSFTNLRGKIAFHLGGPRPSATDASASRRRPNDVVNTIYVDAIRWRKLRITSAWLALVFDADFITGSFGGDFAKDYLGGGVMFGWFGNDPWRVWGGFANVDSAEVAKSLAGEYVTMDGRAKMGFDVQGRENELKGRFQLGSVSPGMIKVYSLDPIIERVEKNSSGIRDDFKKILMQCLRDYPYQEYALDLNYTKPDATLAFIAQSRIGARKLDLHWHGR